MWRRLAGWYRGLEDDLLGMLQQPTGTSTGRFWQIHRGTVVNAGAIAAAERIDAERLQVLLRGCDEKLPVSRTFAHLFRN